MTEAEAYQAFWKQLLPAYPLSKGKLRLPIATELTTIEGLDIEYVVSELRSILNNLLINHGTLDQAKKRARASQEAFLIPLMTPEYTGVVRFDCVWDKEQKETKVLEINCDNPDGMVLHDETYSVLSGIEEHTHQHLLQQLFTSKEHVSVLFSKNAFFKDGYQAEYENLRTHAHARITEDIASIPPNTTIRRCLEVTKLTPEEVRKMAAKKHRFVNSLALRTLGYKDLLAKIHHPFIPKTVLLHADSLSYGTDHQHRLVLKPLNGCEGFDIVFGKNVSQEVWLEKLTHLIDKNYILQEYIELPKLEIALYENGGIETKKLYYDLCPHFFIKNGKVIGDGHVLMRFSENPVVNVSQGGGIGYYKR